MTLEQIKDEIRSLKSSERIELYIWLDYDVATDFCSRIGADRSLEIRHSRRDSDAGNHRWFRPWCCLERIVAKFRRSTDHRWRRQSLRHRQTGRSCGYRR